MWGKMAAAAATMMLAVPVGAQTSPTDQDIAAAEQRVLELKRAKLATDLAELQKRTAALAVQATASSRGVSDPPADGNNKSASTEPASPEDPAAAVKKTEVDKQSAIEKFAGLKFGVGISLTRDLGGRDRIGEARRDDAGIVRVLDKNNSPARVMLESHYFFTPCGQMVFTIRNECKPVPGTVKYDKNDKEIAGSGRRDLQSAAWGFGPFIALQPGGDKNIIDAVGVGLMFGLRRNADTSESFNFGVGVVVDPNTKVLGDGILENQQLPAGETEIRLKETTQTGILFLTSFSF